MRLSTASFCGVGLLAVLLGVAPTGCEFAGRAIDATEEDNEDDGDDVDPSDPDPGPDVDPVEDDDGDGVENGADNCWATPNPLQRDEDADGRGDLCDNCPITANADQANELEIGGGATRDGLGDACDPRPLLGGDRIGYFNTFIDPLGSEWVIAPGSDEWEVNAGGLERTDTNGVGTLYLDVEPFTDVVIDTRVKIEDVASSNGFGGGFGGGPGGGGNDMAGVGIVAHFDGTGGFACIEARDGSDDESIFSVYTFTPAQVWPYGQTSSADPPLATGRRIALSMSATGSNGLLHCQREAENERVSNTKVSLSRTSGFVALHTYRVSATYEYLVVYTLGGAIP